MNALFRNIKEGLEAALAGLEEAALQYETLKRDFHLKCFALEASHRQTDEAKQQTADALVHVAELAELLNRIYPDEHTFNSGVSAKEIRTALGRTMTAEMLEDVAWLKVKPERDRIVSEMAELELKMHASDQPDAADNRTPAQLEERYGWSFAYNAKRKRLGEIRDVHYKAMDRAARDPAP